MKHLLEHKNILITLLIGLFITVIYFKPLFFDNKRLPLHDVTQGMASQKELKDFRDHNDGEEALWTDRMFGGMPLYVTGTVFKSNWAEKINMKLRFLPRSSEVIFLSFACCFIMLLCFKINPYVAGLGAFAFAFNTFNIVSTGAGHIFKILAIAYAPLIIGAIALLFRKKYILGFSLATIGITLEIAARHYQITYYLAFFGIIYVLYETIKSIVNKEYVHMGKVLSILFVASIIGLGPHISRLWSVQEYNSYSIRGKRELSAEKQAGAREGLDKDYAFAWSEGKWESLTLLIPHLYSGSSQEGYWGKQPGTAGPVYAGSVMFFLFIMFLVNIKNIKQYWILIAGLLLLMFSWGSNFQILNYTMFDYFPLFNKFRSVSMSITLTILAFVTGATFGLNTFLKSDNTEQKNILKKTVLGFFGLLFSVYISTIIFCDFGFDPNADMRQMDFLIDLRKGLLNDSVLKVFFINITVVIILWLYTDQKIKTEWTIGFIGLILIGDLLSINSNYLNHDSFTETKGIAQITPTKADRAILKDKSHYRVLNYNNPFNNAIPSYFHNSIGGYHGAKMRRYQDLIELQIGKGNQNVLAMLNTKYIIDQKQIPHKTFFELGPAWYVTDIKNVNTPDAEMDFLGNKTFTPKDIAVIDKSKFETKNINFKNDGEIKLESYEPNHLIYTSKNSKNAFAVFSEIYYPLGWNAYIDGKKSNYVRTNYILRGMELPAGQHKIEFKFEPKSYYLGETYSLLFSILMVITVFGGFGFTLYSYFKKNDLELDQS